MGGFGRKRVRIDDVHVSVDGWESGSCSEHIKEYHHPNGDFFSVNFFNAAPDIEASINEISALRQFYRRGLIANNAAMLQCDVFEFCGLPAIYLLAKARLEPSGFFFTASCTLPKREHSYVLSYQAAEAGVTGMRESAVALLRGGGDIDERTGGLLDWCSDPYDETLKYPLMRSVADGPEYDGRFPDHPLSRTRAFMRTLPTRFSISDLARNAPPFT